jgi:hypothetical protein
MYSKLHFVGSFDLQLEEFGVNIAEFTNPIQRRVFRAWLEDWEKPFLENNDSVADARLRVKYLGLVFFDPDNQTIYSVYPGNLEYRKGRDGGWWVIGVCADDVYDDEPFIIGDMLIEMIAAIQNEPHIQIVYKAEENQVVN